MREPGWCGKWDIRREQLLQMSFIFISKLSVIFTIKTFFHNSNKQQSCVTPRGRNSTCFVNFIVSKSRLTLSSIIHL